MANRSGESHYIQLSHLGMDAVLTTKPLKISINVANAEAIAEAEVTFGEIVEIRRPMPNVV